LQFSAFVRQALISHSCIVSVRKRRNEPINRLIFNHIIREKRKKKEKRKRKKKKAKRKKEKGKKENDPTVTYRFEVCFLEEGRK
jgi:hypothetical protein